MENAQQHWDSIYSQKQPDEVSWTQEVPQTSLDLINSFQVSKKAAIIDIGGGDSKLVDYLLEEGYENLTVLDISEKSLERAKLRLGEKAERVQWIVTDILDFVPQTTYDVWHDRAAFHFLTTDEEVGTYASIVKKAVTGYMIVGTFSENGPKKCSGLEIKQYSEIELQEQFESTFTKIRCITEDHITPFNTRQNFLFCSFERSKNQS